MGTNNFNNTEESRNKSIKAMFFKENLALAIIDKYKNNYNFIEDCVYNGLTGKELNDKYNFATKYSKEIEESIRMALVGFVSSKKETIEAILNSNDLKLRKKIIGHNSGNKNLSYEWRKQKSEDEINKKRKEKNQVPIEDEHRYLIRLHHNSYFDSPKENKGLDDIVDILKSGEYLCQDESKLSFSQIELTKKQIEAIRYSRTRVKKGGLEISNSYYGIFEPNNAFEFYKKNSKIDFTNSNNNFKNRVYEKIKSTQ